MIGKILSISVAVLLASSGNATAQTPSADDIVRKLAPAPAPQTRSLRGVTVAPGHEPEKPTINLYINFEFDSAKLDNDGILTLKRLGAALQDPRLAQYTFEVAGHTDSVGSAEYNRELSERRARAVVAHLVAFYGIAPSRLAAAGYGKSRLLDPANPTDGVNRRVQITNIGGETRRAD